MRIYFQNKREKNKRPREYREGDEIGKQSEKTTECRRDPFSAAEAVENRENVSYNGSGDNEREQKSHFFSHKKKNGQKAFCDVAYKRQRPAENPPVFESV